MQVPPIRLPRIPRAIDPDRLIPMAIRNGDGETLRKARISLYFAMALLVQCAIYNPTYIAQGYPKPALSIAVGAALLLPLPLTLRLPRPMTWASLQLGCLTLGV